jgi:hypothetical protein
VENKARFMTEFGGDDEGADKFTRAKPDDFRRGSILISRAGMVCPAPSLRRVTHRSWCRAHAA